MKHEKQAIKYTPFNEMIEPGEYNCFGIIYDASFPQNQDQAQPGGTKYECILKLIDQHINFINSSDLSTFNNNIITLIIKSQFKEKIPYIHTIGDIIRIHSGIYSHKNKKNIYLTITNNPKSTQTPNWCIFSGLTPKVITTNSIIPILSSKKYYSLEFQDELIIQELRKFIKNQLSLPKSISFPMETALDKRIINKENDTTVQVDYKIELDDKFIYFVQDDTDICELQTNKYFDFINVNDIIRIRSYRCTENNILFTNSFSNILIIPKTLGYYKEFQDKIKEQKILNNKDKKNKRNNNLNEGANTNINSTDLMLNMEEFNKINTTNINNINTSSFYNNIIIPLNEESENDKENLNLFNNDDYSEDNFKDDEEKKLKLTVIDFNNKKIKKFSQISKSYDDNIIEVQIIKYHPINLVKCIKYFCPNCKKIFSIENDFKTNINNKSICPFCNEDFIPHFYYKMIFECIEKKKADKIIVLHLNTFDGEAESIFGLMPNNFNLENEQKNKLNKILIELINSNCYIRLKIRKTVLNNKGIIYRIVGDYTNKI